MVIIKVQRPIAPDATGPWLVYGENNIHLVQIPRAEIPHAVRKAMGRDLKGYFEARWVDDEWEIGRRVEDQDW